MALKYCPVLRDRKRGFVEKKFFFPTQLRSDDTEKGLVEVGKTLNQRKYA